MFDNAALQTLVVLKPSTPPESSPSRLGKAGAFRKLGQRFLRLVGLHHLGQRNDSVLLDLLREGEHDCLRRKL